MRQFFAPKGRIMHVLGSITRRTAGSSLLALALCAGTGAATTWASPGAADRAGASLAATSSQPADAVSYADRLVRAWGAGNMARASRYGTPSVLSTLFGHASPGGRYWWRVGEEGAAGTTYVTYRNGSSPETLVIGVSNVGLASGATQDAYLATFS